MTNIIYVVHASAALTAVILASIYLFAATGRYALHRALPAHELLRPSPRMPVLVRSRIGNTYAVSGLLVVATSGRNRVWTNRSASPEKRGNRRSLFGRDETRRTTGQNRRFTYLGARQWRCGE